MFGVKVGPWGLRDAKIVVVGEAPGAEEEIRGEPFVGSSGAELDKMLHEAGILRNECYMTNVCKHRPPGNEIALWFAETKKKALEMGYSLFMGEYCSDYVQESVRELHLELSQLRPNIIIAAGGTSLWAVTGKSGITKWRGSMMESLDMHGRVFKVCPTYHPAAILRQWENRQDTVQDLRRVRADSAYPEIRYPAWQFRIRPSFGQVMGTIHELRTQVETKPIRLAVDIETRKGYMACVGLAWSRLDAICIPLMCQERITGFWTVDEEAAIASALRNLLTHNNCLVIGQNFGYDAQYFAKEWGIFIQPHLDTMILQHIFLAGRPKGLDYIASMYCDFYQYWKDEGKEWNPRTTPEDQLWVYNCKDAVNTFEAAGELERIVKESGLWKQYEFEAYQLWPELFKMMLRGIRVIEQNRGDIAVELMQAIQERHKFFFDLLGHDLNPRSVVQMRQLFYDRLGCKVVLHRKTKKPSLAEEALEVVGNREPLLLPLIDAINQERSLSNSASVIRSKADPDGRMRCSYGQIPETYRLNSSKNVLGGGANMQNVTKGDRNAQMRMPNLRRAYGPDFGYVILEPDLAGADAQVVAWESGDPVLKQIFREKLKLHAENAKLLYGRDAGPDGKREPYYTRTKQGGHAFNYGASARTVASTIGISTHEADIFKRKWFTIHPWILDWQRATEAKLFRERQVVNPFGYRRFYFDRVESILPEALAWVPQSTVACIINRGLVAVGRHFDPGIVNVLLQVHDSIVIQVKSTYFPHILPEIEQLLLIPLPYADPLTIPVNLSVSDTSWGDAKAREWTDSGAIRSANPAQVHV